MLDSVTKSPNDGWWLRQLYGTYPLRIGPQVVANLDYWAAKPHSTWVATYLTAGNLQIADVR